MSCLYLRLAQWHHCMPTSTILAYSSVPSLQRIYSETRGKHHHAGRCTLPSTAHTDEAGIGTTPARMALERAGASELCKSGEVAHLRDSLAGLAGNQQSCPSKRGNSQQGHSSLSLGLARLA